MAEVAADWSGAVSSINNLALNDNEGFTPDAFPRASNTTAESAFEAAEEHDDDFTGEFKPENISKHDGGANDGGCRICHEDGHFARDCPNKPASNGACFQCGEEGHIKADCPHPAVLKCKICKEEGHATNDCSVNRLFVANNITADVEPKAAWELLCDADEARDFDDIKSALLLYAKACAHSDCENVTFAGLEQVFRGNDMNTFLIAKEQEISVTHTIVDLEGEPNQKYVVSLQFSAKPRRKKQDEGWPADAQENMERLSSAGFVMDGFVTVCRNCGEVGHGRAQCEQEKTVNEVIVECSICNEQGHRARDCTAPRRKPGGSKECRNCGETGHISKDCPSKEARTCKNCGNPDHIAKDCDQPRNEATVTCRNCDVLGHFSKNCPKPTDWSRVTCSNCGEKGHSYKRCKAPAAAAEGEGEGDNGGWGNDAPAAPAADSSGW